MVTTPRKVSDEKLAESIKAQQKVVQTESKGTIINRWNDGKPVTAKQFAEIKGQVDQTAVKEYNKRVPIIDEKTESITGWKDQKMFVNKKFVRIDNTIKASTADDITVANMSYLVSVNHADLEKKNISLHMNRSKLSSLKAESHTRDAARKAVAMKKADVQFMNLSEIYDRAVQAKKLEAGDLADAETEATLLITV